MNPTDFLRATVILIGLLALLVAAIVYFRNYFLRGLEREKEEIRRSTKLLELWLQRRQESSED